MPALPNVPSVIRLSFQHSTGGIPAYVHWFMKYSGTAPAQADITAVANSAKSAWTTNFAGLCHPNLSLTVVQATDLSSASGAQGVSTGSVAGSRTGGPLTANDCCLINLKMARRYRGGKPRQYWPFGTDSDVLDPQHWTSTFTSAVSTGWNAVNSALAAITWAGGNMVLAVNVSYYQGFTVVTSPTTGRARNVPKPRATPLVDNITSASIQSRIATQRRRQHFSA